MTYATVMVSLALDQPNEARLQVAGELAERFEAALVGVAAARFAPPLYFTDGAEAQRLIDQEEASVKRCLADLEAEFRAATKNARRARGMAQRHGFSRAISCWRRRAAPTSSSAAGRARPSPMHFRWQAPRIW